MQIENPKEDIDEFIKFCTSQKCHCFKDFKCNRCKVLPFFERLEYQDFPLPIRILTVKEDDTRDYCTYFEYIGVLHNIAQGGMMLFMPKKLQDHQGIPFNFVPYWQAEIIN